MPNFNNNDIENLIDSASKRMGTDKSAIENATKSADVQKLLNNMSPEQFQKIQGILNDKEASEKLLNTPQAKALLKKFMPNS